MIRSLKENITVVITTSPIEYHPYTEMIEIAVRTMNKCLDFRDVKKIITCDDCIDSKYEKNYNKYKDNLDELCNYDIDFKQCKIIKYKNISNKFTTPRLQDIFKDVIKNHITTSLFMHLQHDFCFIKNIDIIPTLNLVYENKIKFIMLNLYNIKSGVEHEIDGVHLIENSHWIENCGICLSSYYNHYVFPVCEPLDSMPTSMNKHYIFSSLPIEFRPHFLGKLNDSPAIYHLDGGVFPNQPRDKYWK